MMDNRRRMVIDTNVLVSAVMLLKSVSRQAFDKFISDGVLLLSEATYAEVEEVLHRDKLKKYITETNITLFLTGLSEVAHWVEVTLAIEDCRDPKDTKFLELAVSGQAIFVIIGDEDLQSMHPYRGISIVSPRAFVDEQ